MKSYDELKQTMKKNILLQIDYSKEVSDEEIQAQIDEYIVSNKYMKACTLEIKKQLRKDIFHSIRKLDVLQDLIDDKEVTEIMINGFTQIFMEKNGKVTIFEKQFESEEKLRDVIQQIVASCNRTVNEASPIVDGRLQDGSRVNVVLPPIALNGPTVTIRRFPKEAITMNRLIELEALPLVVAEWLETLVKAKYNIFISGGTSSGKTTFLNALSAYVPKEERIITIEDSAELQIQGVDNLVRLETRNQNVAGCLEITMGDLIKSSLRMRPERIIVGEVRGREALDMLQAMNTGHDGSMSTGHANSAREMLSRLEMMVLMGAELPLAAIRGQIATGIDIIVHLGRDLNRKRKVLEILEVLRVEEQQIVTNLLYQYDHVESKLVKRGELVNVEKITMFGEAVS